jgi:hypothetical protein
MAVVLMSIDASIPVMLTVRINPYNFKDFIDLLHVPEAGSVTCFQYINT